jgi:multidrug efflux system outer membrane protein
MMNLINEDSVKHQPQKTCVNNKRRKEFRNLGRVVALSCLGVAMAAVVILSGCAPIPVDRDVAVQQDLAQMQLAGDIKLASEGWPEAQWWTRYQDPQLDGLMHQALSTSPTLAMAGARIGAARQALAFSNADRDVNVRLDAGVNWQRYSSNGLFPAPIGGAYYTEETIRLQAGYDFDWWGRHRAQVAAAVGEINARRADFAMAEQNLAAAIAQSYFALQNGWARVAKQQQIIDVQSNILDDRARRIAAGLANIDARHDAEADLSAMREDLARLQAQNGREREALRALLGDQGVAVNGQDPLASLQPRAVQPSVHALPAKLGIELLARRPDLQAARWRVQASLSRIDAARAAFYPDVNLTGAIGLDAVHLSHLLEGGSRTPFVGPTLSLPLFDSGRQSALLGQARTERNEMIADYNQNVFNVVRDVARSGLYLQGVERQLQQQAATAAATGALQASAQARLRQGLASRGAALGADMAVLRQQDAALQLQGQQLLAEVALVNALGGGYRMDTRVDMPPATAALAPAKTSAQ